MISRSQTVGSLTRTGAVFSVIATGQVPGVLICGRSASKSLRGVVMDTLSLIAHVMLASCSLLQSGVRAPWTTVAPDPTRSEAF